MRRSQQHSPVEPVIARAFDVAAGGQLELSGAFHRVLLTPTTDQQARVTVHDESGVAPRPVPGLVVEQVRHAIHVTLDPATFDAPGTVAFPPDDLVVALALPSSLHVTLRCTGTEVKGSGLAGSLDVTLYGGSLLLEDCSGDLLMTAYHAPVVVNDFDGANVTLCAYGGALRGDNIRAQHVSVTTAGGWTSLRDVSGTVVVRAEGGTLEMEDPAGSLEGAVCGGQLTITTRHPIPTHLLAAGAAVDVILPNEAAAGVLLRGRHVALAPAFFFRGERAHERIEGRLNAGGPAYVIDAHEATVAVRTAR